MSISTDKSIILNTSSPVDQDVGFGTESKSAQDKAAYDPIFIKSTITADATGGKAVAIPYAFELIEVIAQCRATTGSGAITVFNGANAITDTLTFATDTNITRAGTIDDAQSTILTTDSINIITNGANDRGLVTLVGYRA